MSSFQDTLSHEHNFNLITWWHTWNLKQNDRQPHLTDGSTDIAWPRNYPCLSWRHHPWPCRMSSWQWRASLDSLNKDIQSEFSFNDHCQWVKCRLLFSPSISEMPILIVCGRAVTILMSKMRSNCRKKCDPLQSVDFKNHGKLLRYFFAHLLFDQQIPSTFTFQDCVLSLKTVDRIVKGGAKSKFGYNFSIFFPVLILPSIRSQRRRKQNSIKLM